MLKEKTVIQYFWRFDLPGFDPDPKQWPSFTLHSACGRVGLPRWVLWWRRRRRRSQGTCWPAAKWQSLIFWTRRGNPPSFGLSSGNPHFPDSVDIFHLNLASMTLYLLWSARHVSGDAAVNSLTLGTRYLKVHLKTKMMPSADTRNKVLPAANLRYMYEIKK